MCFVTSDECRAEEKNFIFRDMAVGYQVYRQTKLEQSLSTPSLDWPFQMGMLSVLKVLYGTPELVDRWLQIGKSVPLEAFHSALGELLPELVIESYGRILSCQERGDEQDLACAVLEVLFEMNQALCLLNGSWVTHDYTQGFEDAYRFAKLPKDYSELVPRLWVARGFAEVVPMAKALVGNFWELLRSEGIRVVNYEDVKALPL
jgi:kanamycin nucleotidyltransferase